MRVLFQADAGPRAGLGHLQRCLSLAAALQRRGATCRFLAGADEAVRRRVEAAGCAAEVLWGDGTPPALEAARRASCEIIIVDSYAAQEGEFSRLREAGLVVVAIDDLARQAFSCQLVVNGGAHAAQLAYRSSSGDTAFLLGPQYALLRQEFAGCAPRKTADTVTRVLLMLGGSDAQGLMPRLLDAVDGVAGSFDVTAVVGPLAGNGPAVDAAAARCRRAVTVARQPQDIKALMAQADAAVSAAGQTLYELASVGCPTVAIEVAENQRLQLEALARAGCALSAGRAGEAGALRRACAALQQVVEDAALRARMARAGQACVDGQGAERVAQAIAALPRQEGSCQRKPIHSNR